MLFIYFISELFLTVLVMLPTCFTIVLNRLVTKLYIILVLAGECFATVLN